MTVTFVSCDSSIVWQTCPQNRCSHSSRPKCKCFWLFPKD